MRIRRGSATNTQPSDGPLGARTAAQDLPSRPKSQLNDGTRLSPGVFIGWQNTLTHYRSERATRNALASVARQIPISLDMEQVCRLLGVEIRSVPLGGPTAVAHRMGGRFLIVVDPKAPRDSRPFVIAHELAHHLLTPALRNGLPEASEEALCDYFASWITGTSRSALSA
jgi:hypothetical protein